MSDFQPILQDLTAITDELAEVGDEALSAIKAGRRHSADDEGMIQDIYDSAQQIADLAVQLGATPGEEETEEEAPDEESMAEEMDEETSDAMKMLYNDPIMYAQHECGDIMAACSALQALSQLAGSELGESNPDEGTLPQITKAMRLLLAYIGKEIDAVDGAGGEAKTMMVEGDDSLGGVTVPVDAKGIDQRDDVSSADKKRAVSEYGKVEFADAKNKKYPVDTEDHIRSAWNYIGQAKNQAMYTAEEVTAIKNKIVAAWKKVIDKAGPPSAATKGIEFIGNDLAVCPGYDVKAIDGAGWTGGYLIRFGGEGDLSHWRDIFTPETDYGHAKSSDTWVHHRMLPGLGKRRLNNPAEIGVDDVGVFIKHLLDMRDPYERSLYSLVQQGKLGWSSGAPSHLVERKALDGGRHEITCWPLGTDSSYTPCPAGGFSVDAKAVKSLFDEAGLDLLAALYDDQPDDTAKAIELELLAIEEEYAALASFA